MAINVFTGFTVKGQSPIDTRLLMSKEAMLAANPNLMPSKYLAICTDDGKLYLYDKNIETPSAETGKFYPLNVDIAAGSNGQILMFSEEQDKWIAVDLVKANSALQYSDGINLKGFNSAQTNQYPYKDASGNLSWKNVIDQSALDAAVQAAQGAAAQSNNYATISGNWASNASTSAQQAAASVTTIQNWIAQKFWWGSEEEFNALEEIMEGTFYFVQR